MKQYTIKPLLTGWWTYNWGSVIAPFADGYVADMPIFIFLVEGEDGEKIVLDASFKQESVLQRAFKSRRTPDQEVGAALEREGVAPDSIRTVILTHLHTDHAGCLDVFKNADFYLQETELVESYHPMGLQAVGCEIKDWIDFVPRFKLVNGEFAIRDGIDLIPAPGHTPGHQAVRINTSKGRAVYFGDSCCLYAGLAKRFPMQFFDLVKKTSKEGDPGLADPDTARLIDRIFSARFGGYFGPIVLNMGDNMRTMHKLDLMADIVIPAHDPELLRMNVLPDKYDIENV